MAGSVFLVFGIKFSRTFSVLRGPFSPKEIWVPENGFLMNVFKDSYAFKTLTFQELFISILTWIFGNSFAQGPSRILKEYLLNIFRAIGVVIKVKF